MEETARYYDDYWNREAPPDTDPRTPRRLEIFQSFVPRSVTVLDVGCGRGRCSAALSRGGYRVVGVDISEGAGGEARAAVPEAQFHVQDLGASLSFLDASCGAAFVTDVM